MQQYLAEVGRATAAMLRVRGDTDEGRVASVLQDLGNSLVTELNTRMRAPAGTSPAGLLSVRVPTAGEPADAQWMSWDFQKPAQRIKKGLGWAVYVGPRPARLAAVEV